MHLHVLDIVIIVAYLCSTVLIGYWVSKRASQSMQNYFLGGNSMPWYMLGISNASGMFDISGTMLLVSWMFVYGLKSVWIPWLWPTFNQIFLMVYLSAWLRRSNVMTGAEWIKTVDQDAFRHRDWRATVACDRSHLRVCQHHWILHLCLQGHRQICADLSAVESDR
jgi:Na+/pantothenate symporter